MPPRPGRGSLRLLCSASAQAAVRGAPPPTFDVLVVGGGTVGALFACLLRASPLTRGLSVAVADAGSLCPASALASLPPAAPSPRCSTLSPASVRLLATAGAWPAVAASGRAAPFARMQVWDGSPAAGCVRYSAPLDAAPGGGDAQHLGWVVEDALLRASLLAVLKADPGVALLSDDVLTALSLPAGDDAGADHGAAPPAGDAAAASPWARAALARTGAVTARLVVAADGARSVARALAGCRVLGWRYDSDAVVAAVAAECGGTAWQRFTPTGPLALLPGPLPGTASLVWTVASAGGRADQLMAMDDAAFAAAADAALAGDDAGGCGAAAAAAWPPAAATRLLRSLLPPYAPRDEAQAFRPPPRISALPPPAESGAGMSSGRRSRLPLRLGWSHPGWRPRFVTLGDAALSVHPLAGRGLNLGLEGAAALAADLTGAVRCGEDVGADAVLRRRAAGGAALRAAGWAAGLDCAARLFGGFGGAGLPRPPQPPAAAAAAAPPPPLAALPAALLAAARSAGMDAVGASPGLRAAAVRAAAGWAPPAPGGGAGAGG